MTSRNRAGTYYRPMPLDFEILARLPEKGIQGGVHWRGVMVRHLLRDLNESLPAGFEPLKESTVSSRLRSMAVVGYVQNFPATGGAIWAKTTDGVAFETTRSAVLGV